MAGLTAAAILGGAGIISSIAGPIVGSAMSSGDKQKAADALAKAQEIINTVLYGKSQEKLEDLKKDIAGQIFKK